MDKAAKDGSYAHVVRRRTVCRAEGWVSKGGSRSFFGGCSSQNAEMMRFGFGGETVKIEISFDVRIVSTRLLFRQETKILYSSSATVTPEDFIQ